MVKFHWLSVMFNVKVGRGSFSNLVVGEGGVCCGGTVGAGWLDWVWYPMRATMLSQVGVPAGVVYSQFVLEHARGAGATIVMMKLSFH